MRQQIKSKHTIMEIKFDKKNYRKHSEQNKKRIKKSLKECGAGRSVLVDADDTLIAGNGVFEQAQAMGIPTRVVETDGTELVVVKRTDLRTDDEKRKLLAMTDNATSDNVEWDMETLNDDFDLDVLEDWDIKLNGSGGNNYSRKIAAPIYEPTMEIAPMISDCVNTEKYDQLIAEIEHAEISDDDKRLLKLAASRHIAFDYKNIAERYAHADKLVQQLMENSALVIIDFEKAIENGFIKMTKRLQETISE